MSGRLCPQGAEIARNAAKPNRNSHPAGASGDKNLQTSLFFSKLLERIHHELYVAVRERAGREASPSVAIIDSQSAKAAQKGGRRSIRKATMLARRSRAASGTSWSTRSA